MGARLIALCSACLLSSVWISHAIAADTGEISASARKKGMKEAPSLIKATGISCSLTDARVIETRTRSSFAGAAASVSNRSVGGGGPGGGGPPPGGGGGGGGGEPGGGGGGAPPGGGGGGPGGPGGASNTQYELACAEGLGYMVTVVNKMPDAVNCIEQNGLSSAPPPGAPPAGPGAGGPPGPGGPGGAGGMGAMPPAETQAACVLPGNTNAVAAIAPFVAKAGVSCNPTQVRGVGRSASNTLFEVACDNNSGYLLLAARNPDAKQPVQSVSCADLDPTGKVTCTLTDPNAALKIADELMAQSERSCAVVDRRLFGTNDSGEKFYEVSCVDGAGYVIQQMPDGKLGQTITCADIGDMAGGCKLTTSK